MYELNAIMFLNQCYTPLTARRWLTKYRFTPIRNVIKLSIYLLYLITDKFYDDYKIEQIYGFRDILFIYGIK